DGPAGGVGPVTIDDEPALGELVAGSPLAATVGELEPDAVGPPATVGAVAAARVMGCVGPMATAGTAGEAGAIADVGPGATFGTVVPAEVVPEATPAPAVMERATATGVVPATFAAVATVGVTDPAAT